MTSERSRVGWMGVGSLLGGGSGLGARSPAGMREKSRKDQALLPLAVKRHEMPKLFLGVSWGR